MRDGEHLRVTSNGLKAGVHGPQELGAKAYFPFLVPRVSFPQFRLGSGPENDHRQHSFLREDRTLERIPRNAILGKPMIIFEPPIELFELGIGKDDRLGQCGETVPDVLNSWMRSAALNWRISAMETFPMERS